MNYQYNYDKMDNITSKVTGQGDYAYDYDDMYRLTDVDNPDFADEGFTYDGVGNRLTAEGVTGNWSYNTNNELNSYDDVSYVYDANGNTTNKTNGTSETKYIYNTEDRLSEVRDGSDNLIASYYYDPFGRRLWKEVSGTRTYFHYADEGLIGEYDSTGNEIKTYGYKPYSAWSTNPLLMKNGNEYFFYHNDHLGTPQKITAVNGAVVWAAKYTSFLNADVDSSSTNENNLRAPGQYFDAETGLHYNGFRYYDPNIGRYLRTDPIGLDAGINLFGYTDNNPINKIDNMGLRVNGCGPDDWRNKLVPNRPLLFIDFRKACNEHDRCYAECESDKDECDLDFYANMGAICYDKYGWNSVEPTPPLYQGLMKTCLSLARIYHEAVSRYGDDAHKNAQKCCK